MANDREAFGYGYARGDDGLLTKKYDPHAETRRKRYEEELGQHEIKRGYATNDASTSGARGDAARARALAKREEKIARARKFNERHAKAVAKHSQLHAHRDNEKYMDDFHEAYGLPPRETPKTDVGNVKMKEFDESRWTSWQRPAPDVASRWRRGPLNARGGVVNASDRPLLCLSVSPDGADCVVGSADHAAYGLDPFKAADSDEMPVSRTLYTKRDGHAEWVTAVAHVPSSRSVLSAGMDGKVIFWQSTRATELQSAGPSVSTLLVDTRSPLAISCAYDGRSTLWHLESRQQVGTLAIGTAPVLCACWKAGLVVAGDRDGVIAAYQVGEDDGTIWRDGESGPVLCVTSSEKLFLSGAQDGRLRCWDSRSGECVAKIDAHVDKRAKKAGAVGSICPVNDNLVATAGADHKIAIFDLRRLSKPVTTLNSHGSYQPLCMTTLGPLVISGDTGGNVLCHDTSRSDCAWGLGANRKAVRALDARPDLLVVAGDDGNLLAWRF